MAQITVYGHAEVLEARIPALSTAIHRAAVSALGLPEEKRFHRFIPLASGFFVTPPDRSIDYTIIEVSMFAGRTEETKKSFLRQVVAAIDELGEHRIRPHDLEITITETPRANWMIRGVPADELGLNYAVEV
jgi:hypothetical protein